MLKKNKRFTKKEFEEFLLEKELFTVYNHLGTLKYKKGESEKFAVVTSGKHEKRAVIRNKVRRRIYDLLKKYFKNKRDIFYTSKQSFTFDYDKTETLIKELFTKSSK